MTPIECEFVDLCSETIRCAREGQWVAAGMWIKEAFDARDMIACERKRKLATRLLEAVLEAVEVAETRQFTRLVSQSLQRVRSSRPGPAPAVCVGLPHGQ